MARNKRTNKTIEREKPKTESRKRNPNLSSNQFNPIQSDPIKAPLNFLTDCKLMKSNTDDEKKQTNKHENNMIIIVMVAG